MKIMTLNIWNYNRPWPLRRRLIADLILRERPDVVALQETRHDFRFEGGRGQGDQLAELTGYCRTSQTAHVYVRFPRVDEGLTILTGGPPRRVMVHDLPQDRHDRGDRNHRILLGVTVTCGGREIDVYDAHFALSPSARRRNAGDALRAIRLLSGERPALLAGDLNALPDETAIRFITGSDEIDGATGDFLDCWDAVHPDLAGFTDESWHPVRRIDYVLGRNLPAPPVTARVVGDNPVGGIFPSDHLGVVVELPV